MTGFVSRNSCKLCYGTGANLDWMRQVSKRWSGLAAGRQKDAAWPLLFHCNGSSYPPAFTDIAIGQQLFLGFIGAANEGPKHEESIKNREENQKIANSQCWPWCARSVPLASLHLSCTSVTACQNWRPEIGTSQLLQTQEGAGISLLLAPRGVGRTMNPTRVEKPSQK